MEIKAQLNYLRISPRKVRLVSGLIDGLGYIEAKHQLDHLAKRSSRPISKLLDSAAANAKNLYGLAEDNLYIKKIVVNEGPTLKRYKPKGFGSAMPIAKRSSHVTVILEEKEKASDTRIKPKAGGTEEQSSRADSDMRKEETRGGTQERAVLKDKECKDKQGAEEAGKGERSAPHPSKQAKYDAVKEVGKKKAGFKGIKRLFRRKSI